MVALEVLMAVSFSTGILDCRCNRMTYVIIAVFLNDLCTEIVIEVLVNTVEDAMILMCNYGYL